MKLACLMPLSPENIATTRKLGYDAIEANIGWLDQPTIAKVEAELDQIKSQLREHKLAVTAVAIYGSTIQAPEDEAVAYWERAMRLAQELRCNVVCGLTGRDNALTVEDNLPLFGRYFGRICDLAEKRDLRIGLEPWPGRVFGHGPYTWTNLASTPELWDKLFAQVPSAALGLEFDPSHLAWQGIDYLQALRDYRERIVHLHAKGIVIDQARLRKVGIHGRGWWRFVLPGLGQIDWNELFAALHDIDYRGDVAVEHQDHEYLDRRWNEGLSIALKTLRPLVEAY